MSHYGTGVEGQQNPPIPLPYSLRLSITLLQKSPPFLLSCQEHLKSCKILHEKKIKLTVARTKSVRNSLCQEKREYRHHQELVKMPGQSFEDYIWLKKENKPFAFIYRSLSAWPEENVSWLQKGCPSYPRV